MKHANVSIFIAHNGCPNKCSFCNQHTITNSVDQPTQGDVKKAVETAINSLNIKSETSEIAFFGGSFTAIDKNYMAMLLQTVSQYVKKGYFSGIRISTRPDAIDKDILNLLKRNHVTSIELGAQSMDDEVLKKNFRGHSAKDVINASHLIKEQGFSLGLQMMTGLYGDDDEKAKTTVESIIALQPETVRIYPTIVMPNTYLQTLYEQKRYAPQRLESAVELCSVLLQKFAIANINVIRVGLHDTPNIKSEMIAGPYHPAFRELCESAIMRRNMAKLIDNKACEYTFEVNPKDISKAIGQKKENLLYFKKQGILLKFVQNKELHSLECRLKD